MGGKILLVDDEERMRKLIRDFLAKEGFQVDECTNGLEAVDKCRMDPSVSLVIMDVMMPVMDGYEATREIRALSDKKLAEIPVIAMTANAFSEDVQKASEAGMNAHVAKPIDINELKKTLNDILA